MEWQNETVIDFLDYYQEEPLIWNASHPGHKNRNQVHDAWRRIEEKLGYKYSITELKKKKDSLMASYRSCHLKVRSSIRSGAGADEMYKPTWFAYGKMVAFLRDKDQPKETINSEEIKVQEQILNEEVDVDVETTDSDVPVEMEKADIENNGMVLPSGLNASPKCPFPKKGKNSATDEIRKKMNDAYSILQSSAKKSAKKKDVCDLYGELVAAKLRAMDDQSREITMNRMDNLLFEMKMKQNVLPNYNNYYSHFPQQNFTPLPPYPITQNCESQIPLSPHNPHLNSPSSRSQSHIDHTSSGSQMSNFPSPHTPLLNSHSSHPHSHIDLTTSIPESSNFPSSQITHVNSSSSNSSVSNFPSPYHSNISSPSQNSTISSDSDNIRDYYKNSL